MDHFDIVDFPAFRFLFFLTIAGVFFYRSFPKPEWKWYIGLPIYWLYILFVYFGFSGMISAGLGDVLKGHTRPKTDVDAQLTITSIILLFGYRLLSRYIGSDEP